MGGLSRREQLRQANEKKIRKEDAPSIVDDVIKEDSKNSLEDNEQSSIPVTEKEAPTYAEIPANSETHASTPSQSDEKTDIVRFKPPVKKQTKSIRKCFLITPEMDDKLKKLSMEYETSENEIINQILSQVV